MAHLSTFSTWPFVSFLTSLLVFHESTYLLSHNTAFKRLSPDTIPTVNELKPIKNSCCLLFPHPHGAMWSPLLWIRGASWAAHTPQLGVHSSAMGHTHHARTSHTEAPLGSHSSCLNWDTTGEDLKRETLWRTWKNKSLQIPNNHVSNSTSEKHCTPDCFVRQEMEHGDEAGSAPASVTCSHGCWHPSQQHFSNQTSRCRMKIRKVETPPFWVRGLKTPFKNSDSQAKKAFAILPHLVTQFGAT